MPIVDKIGAESGEEGKKHPLIILMNRENGSCPSHAYYRGRLST